MNKVKVGDIVISLTTNHELVKGKEYTITKVDDRFFYIDYQQFGWFHHRVDEENPDRMFDRITSDVMFIKEYKTSGRILWRKNGLYKIEFCINGECKRETFIREELEGIEVKFKAFE